VLADVEEWFRFRRYGYREGQEIGELALLIAHLTCLWNEEPQLNSPFAAHVSLSCSVTHGFARIRELVREWVSQLNAADGTTGISLLLAEESVSRLSNTVSSCQKSFLVWISKTQ
jgi:hypothetical protein